MTKIHNPHDRYFRTLMASSEVAQEFFEKHLPNKIINILDLKSLQLQHNSYIDDVLHEQIVDLLYSAIERIMPELQKIENSDRINYVFTTIKYFFEVGETPNPNKFKDVIQRGLTKSGDKIMTFAEQLRSEGYQEGISRGISQGINQGINRGKTEVAINLLRQGLDIKIIAKSTNLPIAQILELKKEIEKTA